MSYIFLHVEPMLWGACFWYWLWTLGAFLLGSLLTWWLLSRNKPEPVDNSQIIADRDRYHASATKWEKDYNSLKYQLEEAQKAEADLRAGLANCEADKHLLQQEVINTKASAAAAFAAGAGAGAAGKAALDTNDGDDTPDSTAALGIAAEAGADAASEASLDVNDGDDVPDNAAALGIAAITDGGDDAKVGSVYDGLFAQDNFQIIEGVGPKVNKVLKDAGYNSWKDIAAADAEDLKTVLSNAGKNFALSNPTSWPHQAKLAAAGDWPELIRYQKFTDGGRETTGDFQSDSKFEKLAAKELGFSSNNPNDLKVVEGIGPKIEGLLKADGINTWSDLAEASQEKLQAVLDAAGPRYKMAIPRTWPQQAALAAAGDWKALKELQDVLDGGK